MHYFSYIIILLMCVCSCSQKEQKNQVIHIKEKDSIGKYDKDICEILNLIGVYKGVKIKLATKSFADEILGYPITSDLLDNVLVDTTDLSSDQVKMLVSLFNNIGTFDINLECCDFPPNAEGNHVVGYKLYKIAFSKNGLLACLKYTMFFKNDHGNYITMFFEKDQQGIWRKKEAVGHFVE